MANRNFYLLLILLSLIPASHVFTQNNDRLMIVKIGRNFRGVIIDRSTQTAKVLKYDNVYEMSDSLLIVYYNDKFGYIDIYGNEIIAPKYDYVENFDDGFAVVALNSGFAIIDSNRSKHDEEYKYFYGKKGLIDKTGKIIVPIEFNELKNFSEGLAYVGATEPYFIDKKGNKVISGNYSSSFSFSEGLAYVAKKKNNPLYKESKPLSQAPLADVASTPQGSFDVLISIADIADEPKYLDQFGFIDKENNIVIPLKYDGAGSFSEGLASVSLKDKYGFVDKTGKEIISLEYDKVSKFKNGIAIVEVDNKYGAIDREGKIIIPTEYNKIEWNSNKLEATDRYSYKGLFDTYGNEIVPVKYNFIDEESDGVFMLAKKEPFSGYVYSFVNNEGENITGGATYQKAEPFSDSLAKVLSVIVDEDNRFSYEKKYGFINTKGEMIIDIVYDEAESFSEGMARVGINNGSNYDPEFIYGFIDTKGKTVVEPIYRDAGHFSEGLVPIKNEDNKWGYINKTGEIVIPTKYREAQGFHNGFAIVYNLESEMLFIDKDGNEYETEFEEKK